MSKDAETHTKQGFAHVIKAARGIEDIDLAFAIASWSDFEKLRKSAFGSDAFQPHPSGTHSSRREKTHSPCFLAREG